ncbi:hypothetical protein [Proteus genomosp. 6]|uniref:hypothetical protein n=1 Tax=Proteus genomosp. 6 TaxID=1311820 RepID=UPI000D69C919|nr:hypothetical protein [Proteus genomosp. 6]
MTVSTELSHEEYVGNGVTTDFDFRFRIFESRHLIVVVADNDGNETTLKNGTDYTIVGAGSYHGGKVVLNKPLAQGWKILLERDLPVVQETDLRNQGKFFAEVHEDAFDYLTMLIQKTLGFLSLCLRKPTYLSNYYDAKKDRIENLGDPKKEGDATNKKYVDDIVSDSYGKTLRVRDKTINTIPDTKQRSNKILAFDDNGQPITILPESGSASDVLIELAKPTGANLINTIDGHTVQEKIDDILKNNKLTVFNTQKEALIFDGEENQIRVMGWKEFGDTGSGIFIIDPHQEYNTPNSIDRFKNVVTGKYWLRILDDSTDSYIGLENIATIKGYEKRNNSPWNQLAPLNVLGDSITYGYFSSYDGAGREAKTYGGGLFYHSWTSLFARMFAADNGTNSYKGFIPLPLGYGDDWDVFKLVSKVGLWEVMDDGLYASNTYSGSCYQTKELNAELVYSIPSTFDEIQLFYCTQPNGGIMQVLVNGELWHEINTSSNVVKNLVLKRRILSNKQGNMILTIKKIDKTSNPIGVSGIGVDNVVTFTSTHTRGGSLNQFATPGRTLMSVSQDVIADVAKNASGLILALGFNDKNISYSGEGNIPKRIEFSQRIDWLIEYCNVYNTPLIVVDFTWSLEPWRFTRRELRRAARETKGVYIPFPDLLIKGRLSTDVERMNNLRMFYDGAHPNRNGQQWIAEMIAKYLGLSCTSKKDAILHHDYWMPLNLSDEWININTSQNWNIASYRINGSGITIKASIGKTDNTEIGMGVHSITSDGKLWCYGLNPPIMMGVFANTKGFEYNDISAVAETNVKLSYDTNLKLLKFVNNSKGIQGSCTFEITKYDA